MKIAKETPRDVAIFNSLPEGWFEAERLIYTIRSPRARCQRLEALGRLESRVVGTYPHLTTEFRRIAK